MRFQAAALSPHPDDLDAAFPEALAAAAPPRWRYQRDFSLTYAAAHATRGNAVGALGQAVRAVFEEAHARACAQRRWVLYEKRLLDGAGLEEASALLTHARADGERQLTDLIERLRRTLTASPSNVPR